MTAQQEQIQSEIDRLTGGPVDRTPGHAGEIGASLKRIGELAAGAFPEAEAVATELLEQVSQAGGPDDEILKAGLIRLQEVFGNESQPPAPAGGGLSDDPELVADFVVEAREHLANIETNLLQLEKNPALTDAVHSVFRSFHTIKGLTGFLALGPMHVVSHETESLLHHAREGRIPICGQLIDVALKAADFIRVALNALTVKPPQQAMTSLASNEGLIREIAATSAFLLEAPPATAVQGNEVAPGAGGNIESAGGSLERYLQNSKSADETVCATLVSPVFPLVGQTVSSASAACGRILQLPLESARGSLESVVAPVEPRPSDASVVRVETGKLEYLVEMVGELVIAQSMIHMGATSEGKTEVRLSRNFAHLGRVTGEIQKTVLSMRMVPISRLYDKMARLVRDLGRKSGKQIELRRIGDQVELDRNIVEEITDPFVHMIRNSVDHGIEDLEARAASGKNAIAYVTLEAFHQAGYIILRMSDDGRGLPTAKIREKAIQKGLVLPDAKLDDQGIHKLIFEPGFSTAERVTEISGRGVGMDVVRRQIEKLRGTIEIESTQGVGCTFTLKLPLTLAMVDGLILEAGGERYVLPIYSVREMFHVTDEKLFTVENRSEMVLLRGSLLPVVRLDRFFANHGQGKGPGEIGIVVEGRTRQFCLVVDRMVGKQEVVIKTLGTCFRSLRGVAGGAILGDGRVGLILDVHGIEGGDVSET